MHIPDGFLSTPVWAALDLAAAPAVVSFARRAQGEFEDRKIPLLGVMGAFVFAAQMINFPVGAGTSGHLVGGALLAIVLGPAAAAVVMTAILAIQALVFSDGGLLVMGANVFNMGIAGVLAGWYAYSTFGRGRTAIFLAGVVSVLVAAVLTVSELLLSGIPMPGAVLNVSFGLFAVSAVIEGAITVAVVEALHSMKPGLVQGEAEAGSRVIAGVAFVALLLAVVGVLFASASPDGLERLAEQIGIAERAKALVATPLADYEAGFLAGAWMRKAAAGLVGLAAILAACLGAGRVIARRRSA